MDTKSARFLQERMNPRLRPVCLFARIPIVSSKSTADNLPADPAMPAVESAIQELGPDRGRSRYWPVDDRQPKGDTET